MSRRRFSEREVIETLLRQGAAISCYRCTLDLVIGEKAEREHIVEIALGGADEPSNCVYSHKDCHAIVTNGTKATTAGSSKHRIAKANNENRKAKFRVNKPPPGTRASHAKREIPSRPNPWPAKGARKMQGRAWQ